MDKATLLAKVISQVKELKKNAVEASNGFLTPMDPDEVKVEPYDDEGKDDQCLTGHQYVVITDLSYYLT